MGTIMIPFQNINNKEFHADHLLKLKMTVKK
jgi:hypothetical protein